MKKYILAFGILSVVMTACSKEDDLTPSLEDRDRAIELADQSKPLVKRLVEKFNCGLLYEYDANQDFRYTAEGLSETEKWNDIEMPTIKEDRFTDKDGNSIDEFEYIMNFPDRSITISSYEEHVDAALSFLDTTLFAYYLENSKIAECFPNKILLASQLRAGKETGLEALTISDSRIASYTRDKSLRSVYNRNSIVFNGNMKDIAPSYDTYKKDNFYVFTVRMMDMYDLYKEFPDELFTSVEPFYGDTIGEAYGLEAPYLYSPYIPVEWYHELGFIDTKYFNQWEVAYKRDYSTNEYYDPYIKSSSGFGSSNRIRPRHMFLMNREEDIRSFLNELIHRSAVSDRYKLGFDDLPENMRLRSRAMADVFISLGIDLRALNPEIESLYQ